MGSWARQTFASLTLEEKVGQVLCYRSNQGERETLAMAREGLIGAVSPGYYAGMIADPERMLAFMNALNAASRVPVLFLSNHACEYPPWGGTPFPGESCSMALAATRDTGLVERIGFLAAKESKGFGLDCVWVPCVDVNTNPRNPIIGTRAFSDRPRLVAEMAAAYVRGMQRARVLPNAKHFPGHGDTGFDTHEQVGVIPHDRRRLAAVELFPYRRLIREGLRGIMTAHLIVPALDATPGLPATLSRRCIHDLLRVRMGFAGVIVSDSLTMKAIRDNFGVEEAVVRAFAAGHDLLCHDYREPPRPSWEALLKAVRAGRVPPAQLDESVMRVLEAKEWAGLHRQKPLCLAGIRKAVARSPAHRAAAREAFARAVTVLDRGGLPLGVDSGPVCVICTRAANETEVVTDLSLSIENGRTRLFREFRARLPDVICHVVPEKPAAGDVKQALAAAAAARTVVFACSPQVLAYNNDASRTNAGQVAVVRGLLKRGKAVCLCVFGTPYVIPDFPAVPACVTTYSQVPEAVGAAVRVMFGEVPATGRLPIDLSAKYRFGRGLRLGA